jgi:hypothetical protein
MLFGNPKSAYYGAFGSGSASSKLAGEPEAANLAQYSSRVKKGQKAIEQGVGSLFDPSIKHEVEPVSEKESQSIKDYVDNGGAFQEAQDFHNQSAQMLAKGGQVGRVEDPLSSLLPEHNLALNGAKSRVSGYLNSVKPQEPPKLAFDAKSSQKPLHKEYDRAVTLAARPLSILKQIKDGSLTPTHLKHFASLYPELHDHLGKQMTGEITKAQLAGKRPSYRTRQGLSLFLGTPLDSSFTPANIMASQATFHQQTSSPQPPAPTKNKKGTATLTKASEQYETSSQAAETRKKQ